MIQNLHTHSIYDDGHDSIQEMTDQALRQRVSVLGFSGHGYNPIDSSSMTPANTLCYLKDVRKVQNNCGSRLTIFCGIEQDSISPVNPEDFDYIIGSVHYVPASPSLQLESLLNQPLQSENWRAVDYSREEFDALLQAYNNDIQALCSVYYQSVCHMIQTHDEIDIIGHVDLISKYNDQQEYFNFDAGWYLDLAKKALDAGLEKNRIFEMNTGAIARGYRSTPYPHRCLLEYLADHDARICFSSDCHNRENLTLGLREAAVLAKECGFHQVQVLGKDGFYPVSIDDFLIEES